MLSSQANDCLEQWKACWGRVSFMIPLYRSQSPKIIVVLSLWVCHPTYPSSAQVICSATTADLKQEYDPFHCGKKERKINNPLVFLSSEESVRSMSGAGLLLTSEQFFHSTASYQAILNGSFSHFCTVANIQSVHHQFFLFHSYLCPLCIVTLWRCLQLPRDCTRRDRKRQILREPVCWEKNQHSVF